MKRLWRSLPALVAAIALIAYLVYGFWPRTIRVDMAQVLRGSILITVDDDGETQIRQKYMISAPVAGKLLRMKLEEGDLVQQDVTEIMHIIPADPALLDARARVESEARLEASRAAGLEAEATLASAREALDLTRHHYDRAKKLQQTRSISQAEFEESEHRFRMATAEVRSAEFRSKVRAYEQELAQAALIQSSPGDYRKQATMRILSPINGAVLRVLLQDESVVQAGKNILEIGDPQDIEIQVDVLSQNAVLIKPGARVIVEQWGGQRPLHGVVRLVEPSAFLKISALGVEEKRVRVIADLVEGPEERPGLGDGFRIEARIVVRSTDEKSLKVPSGALFRHGQQWSLYRVEGGRATLVAVDIGASDGRETEILGGLAEGNTVILHPSEQVRSGTSVRAAN
jgi:HlyD family secretion protein